MGCVLLGGVVVPADTAICLGATSIHPQLSQSESLCQLLRSTCTTTSRLATQDNLPETFVPGLQSILVLQQQRQASRLLVCKGDAILARHQLTIIPRNLFVTLLEPSERYLPAARSLAQATAPVLHCSVACSSLHSAWQQSPVVDSVCVRARQGQGWKRRGVKREESRQPRTTEQGEMGGFDISSRACNAVRRRDTGAKLAEERGGSEQMCSLVRRSKASILIFG